MVKKIPKSVYPNLVTIINVFCGFYSVIASFQGEYMLAFWSVVVGGVADALDGKVARYVDGASEFGVQYDSLADVVTFGFAPSALVFNLLGQPKEAYLIAFAFFPLLLGSIRLARFNANLVGFDKDHFVGMPIPAGALSIMSIVPFNHYLLANGYVSQAIWIDYVYPFIAIVVFYSILMVTTIRYETLPNFSMKEGKENLIKIVALAICIPIILLESYLMVFVVMFIYSIQGVISWLINK
mgnify:CR=1 FL=1